MAVLWQYGGSLSALRGRLGPLTDMVDYEFVAYLRAPSFCLHHVVILFAEKLHRHVLCTEFDLNSAVVSSCKVDDMIFRLGFFHIEADQSIHRSMIEIYSMVSNDHLPKWFRSFEVVQEVLQLGLESFDLGGFGFM